MSSFQVSSATSTYPATPFRRRRSSDAFARPFEAFRVEAFRGPDTV